MLFLYRFFKENTKSKMVVFVLLFILSISGFLKLGNSRIEELEKLMENVLHSFLITSADGISVGYFQWDDMYEAVLSSDKTFFEENKKDILSTFSSVDEIEIIEAYFDGSSYYTLDVQANELILYFGVFDSDSINFEIGRASCRERV